MEILTFKKQEKNLSSLSSWEIQTDHINIKKVEVEERYQDKELLINNKRAKYQIYNNIK